MRALPLGVPQRTVCSWPLLSKEAELTELTPTARLIVPNPDGQVPSQGDALCLLYDGV